MNEFNCADYKENFHSADVIECYNNISPNIVENDLFNIDNQLENLFVDKLVETKNLCFVNFSFENDIQFCKICNQMHSNVKKQKQNLMQENFSLIERIKNASLFKKDISSLREETNNAKEENKELNFNLNKIKMKLYFLEELIDKFQLFSKNYETIIVENLSKIRNQLINMIDNKIIEELSESFNKLIKELESFEQKCLKKVDVDSSIWIDFKKFTNQHQVDSKTISYYLDYKNQKNQVSNHNIIKEIDDFKMQLDEIKKQFNQYIYTDKSILFFPNFNGHFESNLSCLVNFTEFAQQSCNAINQESDDFSHLKSILSQQSSFNSIRLSNSLDASEVIDKQHETQLVTVHSLDASDQVLICKRYTTKSNQSNSINCELHTYDMNGELRRTIQVKNCLVRCINTSSKHVLLTVEYDHDSFSINKLANFKEFNLNLYDSNLELVQSINIESNDTNCIFYPLACFINEDKCYVMKSTMPYVNVYDLELNLLSRFGQDVGPQLCWYFTPQNINKIHVKNNKLFLHKINSDFTSTIVIIDLNTGFNLKKFNIKFNFSNFYILSLTNEILFVSENKLVLYDFLKDKVNYRMELAGFELEKGQTDLITSFCMNNNGFLIASFKNRSLIGIY